VSSGTHKVWQLALALWRAHPALALAWWSVLLLRGALPALFAIAMGALVGAVQRGEDPSMPLAVVAGVFVLLQVLTPISHAIGANLGSRTASWLFDRLALACVSPPGMGHLESPALASDLSMGRDFDLGITAPPLYVSLDFIAVGLVEMIAGLCAAAVLAAYAWWAPLLLGGAWLSTHYLLRESAVWRDRNTAEVRAAQRHADYAYRLAVDVPAAKELRLFGLADFVVARFRAHRQRLFELQWAATRLRERPVATSLCIVATANLCVFGAMALSAAEGRLALDGLVTFASAGVATSMIAFGGLSWALDGASSAASTVMKLGADMERAGTLPAGTRSAAGLPAHAIRFRGVAFAYPVADGSVDPSARVLDGLDLEIPAGTSLAIVGRNGAGKTTLAKLLCRLYDPQAGAIEIDGTDLRELDIDAWRGRLAAVFQDFLRLELSLGENVAPAGAPDHVIRSALADAGAASLAHQGTVLARGYVGGTELSGGQWQRVALARALCAVRLGAGVVLLDEPTAQLDVRGEAAIFERLLRATRGVTTILISHRFSTVRHADRICVIEGGRAVELGTHKELMALGGRYRTMFDLQAARFASGAAEDLESLEAESSEARDDVA
jgi:ABC-type multidrug transport system fused ATPase/permease subunit